MVLLLIVFYSFLGLVGAFVLVVCSVWYVVRRVFGLRLFFVHCML